MHIGKGLVVAFMGMSLDDTFRSASTAKEMWLQNQISLYDIVGHFVDDILVNVNDTQPYFLDRMNILITASDQGTVVRKPTTLDDLKDLMLKTAYMYVPKLSAFEFVFVKTLSTSQSKKTFCNRTSTLADG